MIKKLIAFHAFLLQLFIPGIAQNVGIGNTNPQFLLDVSVSQGSSQERILKSKNVVRLRRM